MSDEQDKEEVETSEAEEPKEQPSEEAEAASEGVKTPEETDNSPEGGDLRVALREERRKRQELDEKLKDPDFVYGRAKELGLTAEEQEELAQPTPTPPVQMDANAMNEFYNYKKEVEKFPEAESEPLVASRINFLMESSKVDGVYTKNPIQVLNQVKKEWEDKMAIHQKAGADDKQAEIADVNQMKTADSDVNATDDDDEDMTDLQKQAKSYNPAVQEKAMAEMIKKNLTK